MGTLADALRASTDLSGDDIDHLHALVADWALLADLSFADLLLLVPVRSGSVRAGHAGGMEFQVVAQVRPTTGPTAYHNDEVGSVVINRWVVQNAWREHRIAREGEPEWDGGVPVRTEAIPVRHGDRVIAVLARDTNLATTRTPSALESAYLQGANNLALMIAEGAFPFRGSSAELPEAPRVGDGMMRLDGAGKVIFASPNALSAYRRLGHTGNVTGEDLRTVHRALNLPATTPAVWHAISRRRPVEVEIEVGSTVVLLRAIPLYPGAIREVLVLVRDVSELRRREAQLLSKDATIREIHHRVKNNLQTVAALLRLQMRRTKADEARDALRESVRRVTSIAVVHETLSQTLGESVPFDEIADQITSVTVDLASTGTRATTRRVGSFGQLSGELATPLALVISELLQNAVEHAFDGSSGAIELRVQRAEDRLDVVVADDGAGLPDDFQLEHSPRLGLQIVRQLVLGEMRGTIRLQAGPARGTEALLSIPLS
ncbi:sensor histidine kinase [Parafrankia discariae]|uniref:sensor histidine kinase n=1 Tax=Parafrankia discariae TaxID=365528 RepID=UPI000371CA1D|nr:sensor histidine kinase [Parafrankia discariae]